MFLLYVLFFLFSTVHRGHFALSLSLSLSLTPIVFSHPQPYYATRVNAADIENRVQELNKKTSLSEETSKAGFWEEFDVRDCWGVLFGFFGILHALPHSPSSISSCTQIPCVSCQFISERSLYLEPVPLGNESHL